MKTRDMPTRKHCQLPPVIITIDGPAGAGKSSVARELANRLGLDFLDTGAMYRAVAWTALEMGIDLQQEITPQAKVAEIAEKANIEFDWATDPPRVSVDFPQHTDITKAIRSVEVTRRVSIVARMPAVRAAMVRQQRVISHQHPRLVTEGRDQGSVVFPDADVIIYLDASPKNRAERRAKQMRDSGKGAPVDVDEVLADILRRDEMDRNREDGPLVKPDSALVVDTSGMSRDEVIDNLEQLVRTTVPENIAATLKTGHQ